MSEPISRRSFFKRMAVGLANTSMVGLAGLSYSNVEPFVLSVEPVDIRLPNLPTAFDGFTIAQISYLHFGEWMPLPVMRQVVQHLNDLSADVIALTGDYVSSIVPGIYDVLTEALRPIQARQAVIAVLGNHDHWTDANAARQAIRAAGNITLLDNTTLTIRRGDEALYLVGVDDYWEHKHDLDLALTNVPANAATVLLAHEPDYADKVALDGRIGLQLSGHSHGGQVRLPGIGALILPDLGRKYNMGLYRIGNMHLYVNRGVGMMFPYVRFMCPPEITLIRLRA